MQQLRKYAAVTMQLIVFLITDAIQFSMWTNPRVEDSPDHLANNVQGVIDIHMLAVIFWGDGTMLVAVYGLTGMLATVFGCAKTMLNAVYGYSGMLAAVFGCAGTMLVAVYGLTGVLLSAVFGRSGIMSHSDWNCSRSCRNQMRRLQENAVSDMHLIAMMLTTAIKISMWNNLPVEKPLDWHNTINLQGAGARNKLVTTLDLQQYWGALETCLWLCLLACWLLHLSTLELCLRLYLGPPTC